MVASLQFVQYTVLVSKLQKSSTLHHFHTTVAVLLREEEFNNKLIFSLIKTL